MTLLDNLYRKSPPFVQTAICSAYGLSEYRKRYGSTFWARYHQLKDSEYASRQEIDAYQVAHLREMLSHAARFVPYYRKMFCENQFDPESIGCVRDLSTIPVTCKQDMVQNFFEFWSSSPDRSKLYDRRTSGTTGTALRFRSSLDAISFQWAVWWRHRARFDVEPHALHLNFTGKPVVPIDQLVPPYWRWNIPMRQALINMQQITPDKIRQLAKFATSRDFIFYSGYPSIVHSFASMIEEEGIELRKLPRVIFFGAEDTQDFQRACIRRVLPNVRLTDQYGLSEGCANASRCEYDNYHEDWEFCVIECVDPEPLPNGDTRGRIVATGFAEKDFPFVRYDTGDYAVWADPNYRCPCGRSSRVIRRIEGRAEDYVLTPEGHKVMRFDYLFKDTDTIVEAQVVQAVEGEILVLAVVRPEFTKNVVTSIEKKVAEMISPSLKFRLETVAEIPRSASGKFKPVISRLPNCRVPSNQAPK